MKPGASVKEIKTAFRKKAKLFHPDKGSSSSSTEFIRLKEAYEFLIKNAFEGKCGNNSNDDPMQNAWKSEEKNSFNYEEWLKEREDDESKVKLVLYYFHVDRIPDSIEALKNLNLPYRSIYFKSEILRNEFMDIGYLLSEILLVQEDYYEAYILLDYIIRLEFSCHYFKHFIAEPLDLARKILRHHLGKIPEELKMDCYEKAQELGFSVADNEFFKKKFSAAYQRMLKKAG